MKKLFQIINNNQNNNNKDKYNNEANDIIYFNNKIITQKQIIPLGQDMSTSKEKKDDEKSESKEE